MRDFSDQFRAALWEIMVGTFLAVVWLIWLVAVVGLVHLVSK